MMRGSVGSKRLFILWGLIVSFVTLPVSSVLALEDWSDTYNTTNNYGNSGLFSPQISTELGSSCADISDCGNCSRTYTCHWCAFDQQCHARGSVHGCSWGATCDNDKPDKKNSTSCSSHNTCRECTLSSSLCHWCEHDNACHAVGSVHGCSVGVDCYSNDRCRRDHPEGLHEWVITEIPTWGILVILGVGAVLLVGLGCCRFCCFNVKGAYDDLHMAASVTQGDRTEGQPASAPPSVIGITMTQPSNNGDAATDNEPTLDVATTNESPDEESPQIPTESGTTEAESNSATPAEVNPEDPPPDNDDVPPIESADLTTPLLSQPPNMMVQPEMRQEPRHMNALYRLCSCCYITGVVLVLMMVVLGLVFFPKPPVYNVCNDEMAWKEIIEHLATFKIDASFEILVSVSNPNHLDVMLDDASGTFTYNGNPLGTYIIPPIAARGVAITDLMVIASVTPSRHEAIQIVEDYYHGKLVLEADFRAKVRAPAAFNVTYNLHITKIPVYVNELGPRDLCHCASWTDDDDTPNTPDLPFLLG